MRRFLASVAVTLMMLVLVSDMRLTQMPNHVLNRARTYPGYLVVSDARGGLCRIWTASAVKGEIAHWRGGCDEMGFASGPGELELLRPDGGLIASLAGHFALGALNGQGSVRLPAGDYGDGYGGSYVGAFREGLKEGQGEEVSPAGRYTGKFQADRKTGRGEMVWASGDRYQGRWLNDRPDGYGEAVIGGVRFAGQWRQGCLLDDPTLGAGRPSEDCAGMKPGLTAYTPDELVLMGIQQEGGELSSWGCQPPKGQSGPGILLCR